MNALVVYESMFGNTEKIARAVAEGLGGQTRVIPVSGLDDTALADASLLVVGGPTQGFGMSRRQTRQGAKDQGAHDVEIDTGVRDLLPRLGPRTGAAAAFDTRINKPRFLTGAASKGIARALEHLGFVLIAGPESFLVTGTTGPLVTGEVDRAKAWGEALRARFESSPWAA